MLFIQRALILAVVSIAGMNQSSAQSKLGIFIGGGTSWYYGDMNDRLLTNGKLFGYYLNGGLLYRAHPKWNIVANIHSGHVPGADSLAIQEYNLRRNLYFRTDILEFSLLANYKFLRPRPNRPRLFTPYALFGAGYFHFNPKAEFAGTDVELQPLGTEGQNINGDGYPKPYNLWQFSVPLGIGVEVYLSRAFTLRIEAANHFTSTDYLDDLSDSYPDSTALAATPTGPLSVLMSSHLLSGFPRNGTSRGDPKQRDSFTHVGVSLLYTPVIGKGGSYGSSNRNGHKASGRKKKKALCPAYD